MTVKVKEEVVDKKTVILCIGSHLVSTQHNGGLDGTISLVRLLEKRTRLCAITKRVRHLLVLLVGGIVGTLRQGRN